MDSKIILLALTMYVNDVGVKIDRNAAQSDLRAIALARENFLYLGCGNGGERDATICTLVIAKLDGFGEAPSQA